MKQQNKIKLKLISISTCLIFAVLVFASFNTKGQNLSASVISTGGETLTEGSYSLDFSIGEISVESYQNQTTLLSQGFLQGTDGITAVDEHQEIVLLEIYPNPVSQILNLKYKTELKPKRCEIVSIIGETILNVQTDQTSCSINVSTLNPGLYFLKLRFSDQSFAIQPFIKQ